MTRSKQWHPTQNLLSARMRADKTNNRYFRYLTIKGVGFRLWKSSGRINMDVGFTHYVSFRVPPQLRFVVKKTRLVLYGNELSLLSDYARNLKMIRLPDSYKGKGIRFFDETVGLKVGKIKT